MFEFDAIDRWGPSLARYLGEVVPTKAYEFLRDRKPKYFEEYRDVLFRAPGIRPSKVISATGDWLSLQPVIAYHGSRLTPAEIVARSSIAPMLGKRRRLVRTLLFLGALREDSYSRAICIKVSRAC